ncbi:MAG TPA: DUF2076 domain-containing protein [Bradyrhizobium sp.]|nr:DUF2076 domain-containing protein [Bradyrhizobium sp.]
MTPQERQLVDDLFDRLAKLESAPRDPNAASAIAQGLQKAPNAVYALVQTALLQDEALKRANSRIEELEAAAGAPQQQGQSGGFLDSMRDAIFGPGQGQNHGSVPNVPPPQPQSRPVWNSGQVLQQGAPGYDQGRYGQPQYGGSPYGQSYGAPPFGGGGGGSSFLGTAAAAAAGMVGGSLLLNSIRGMMGGSHQGFADAGALGDRAASPWSDQSNSSLARDAGIDDIGRGGDRADDNANQGLFDQASYDNDRDSMVDADADDFDDGGGDDGGGSDYA